MSTVLITGANRGIGLEFSQQFANDDWQVLACCRNPEKAHSLSSHPNVKVLALDVSNFTQIDQLATELLGTPIDILINNAGIYGDSRHGGFGNLDYQDWSKTLLINSQAPVKMAEAFLPHLLKGSKKMLVSITSQMGSIADNQSGGSILYRSSKAALNAAMKSLSIDLAKHGIGVIVLHPGWVKTDMGGPNALIDTVQSVTGMRQVIEEFSQDQSGEFLKYDGSKLPW